MTNHPQPPALDLPPDMQPVYINLVRISHSPLELVFDFASLLPGQSGTRVSQRIVMSPAGAKLFLQALADNLSRYESVFGTIQLPGEPTLAAGLFGAVQPPDDPGPPKPDE